MRSVLDWSPTIVPRNVFLCLPSCSLPVYGVPASGLHYKTEADTRWNASENWRRRRRNDCRIVEDVLICFFFFTALEAQKSLLSKERWPRSLQIFYIQIRWAFFFNVTSFLAGESWSRLQKNKTELFECGFFQWLSWSRRKRSMICYGTLAEIWQT